MKTKILIVDDELDIQSSLSFALKDEGFEVMTASSPREALKILATEKIHVGLFDVWFPEGDGIELLQETRELSPACSIVMMSGHGNIELALKAIRMGAFDFLEKPLELEKVLVVLNNAAEVSRLKNVNADLQRRLLDDFAISPTLLALAEKIDKNFKRQKSELLLLGEVGVGKSSLCRWMHSHLGEGPAFVSIHSGALTEENWRSVFEGSEKNPGVLKESSGGVLYLNNVELLPMGAQRFIVSIGNGQTCNLPSGTRLILSSCFSASEWQSSTQVAEEFKNQFASSHFEIPALRTLHNEFSQIITLLLEQISQTYAIHKPVVSDSLMNALKSQPWLGNGRELRNVLDRIVIFRNIDRLNMILDLRDLPEDFLIQTKPENPHESANSTTNPDGTLRDLRVDFERALLQKRLAMNSGNITKTAESLGIERTHLHRKLRQYGMSE